MLILHLILKPPLPFHFKSDVLPIPLLFIPFFLYRIASLVLTLSFGVLLPFTSLTFVISRSFHDVTYAYLLNYHLFHLDLRMVFYLSRPWLHSLSIDSNPCFSSILYYAHA